MRQTSRTQLILGGVVIAIIALVIGWALGRSPNSPRQSAGQTKSSSSSTDPQSLVSFTLPDGWRKATCTGITNIIYLIPNGATLNCSADPSAPLKLTVDAQNTTDCSQLKTDGGVKKHTCISLYIDGHKSLKSFSQIGQSSSYDYYINTGNGVAKIDYTYSGSNDYQNGLNQLVSSLKVKG